MSEPSLTGTVDGPPVLRPLIAQWDTSLTMLLLRLEGLDDAEYRWRPTPGAADLVDTGGVLRAEPDGDQPTRTIAWSLAHVAEMCWVRADYTDGGKNRPLGYGPFPGRAAQGVDELRAAAARWRASLVAATPEHAVQVGYSTYPVGMDPDLPFVDIVWWVNRELIAHGSDVATVRDLYAAR